MSRIETKPTSVVQFIELLQELHSYGVELAKQENNPNFTTLLMEIGNKMIPLNFALGEQMRAEVMNISPSQVAPRLNTKPPRPGAYVEQLEPKKKRPGPGLVTVAAKDQTPPAPKDQTPPAEGEVTEEDISSLVASSDQVTVEPDQQTAELINFFLTAQTSELYEAYDAASLKEDLPKIFEVHPELEAQVKKLRSYKQKISKTRTFLRTQQQQND